MCVSGGRTRVVTALLAVVTLLATGTSAAPGRAAAEPARAASHAQPDAFDGHTSRPAPKPAEGTPAAPAPSTAPASKRAAGAAWSEPKPPPNHLPPTPPTCAATVPVTPAWEEEDGRVAVSVSVEVANLGPAVAPAPWRLALGGPYEGVQQAFNLRLVDGEGPSILADASGYWQALPARGGDGGRGGHGGNPLAPAAPTLIAFLAPNVTDPYPYTVSVNGVVCLVTRAAPQPPTLPQGAAGGVATAEAAAGLTIRDGVLLAPDSTPAYLIGVNWFGFEVGQTMVDGLWGGQKINRGWGFGAGGTGVDGLPANLPPPKPIYPSHPILVLGSDAMAKDFATVVYRMQLLGFNTVRLPFSFKDLFDAAPKPVAQPCTQVTPGAVVGVTTAPGVTPNATAPSPGAGFQASPAGTCNDYVPSSSTLDRFLWVVNYLTTNG